MKTLNTAAVKGAPKDNVTADEEGTFLSPSKYKMYATLVVMKPKYKMVQIFEGSTTHELSKINKNGISIQALMENVIATAGIASTFSNSVLLTIV